MKMYCGMSVLFMVLFLTIRLEACTGGLDNVTAGVVLNSSEQINFSEIYKTGKIDTSYFVDCPQIKIATPKDVLYLSPTVDPPRTNDPAVIKFVNVTGKLVNLGVEYSGGCKTHEFNLYVTPAADSSKTINFYLFHNANKDNCKALITETITFNLASFFDSIGEKSSLSLHFNGPNGGYTDYQWTLDQGCSVIYRSHSSPMMMVTLENIRTSGTLGTAPRVLLTMDPNILPFAPVDYALIMNQELDWLAENKIITGISIEDHSKIKKQLQSGKQYWIAQDSALFFNQTFTGDKDSNGVWTVVTTRGCGVNFSFSLPPKPIDITVTILQHKFKNVNSMKAKVFINSRLLEVKSEADLSRSTVHIISMTGRILFTGQLNSKNSLRIPLKIAGGWHAVIIDNGKSKILCPVLKF